MRKLPLLCLLTLLFAAPALAQTASVSGYRFDNFDTRAGVRVDVPPPPAKPLRQPKNRVRLTARIPAAGERAGARVAEEVFAPTASGAQMAAGKSLDGFSTGSAVFDSIIVEAAGRNNVDPVLLYAIMHQESTFKRRAVSPKGARGLMQLMPDTARRFGVSDIFDPRQNVEGGAKYMRWLLDYFDGDVRLALAGYNAGEGAVLKYGRNVPPYAETQNYVRRIFQRYTLMRDPASARAATKVTAAQVAAIGAAERPGVTYEQHVYVVRLPDGKLRLVSQ
jgi:soluble lytic murein transglycosylase-like protein